MADVDGVITSVGVAIGVTLADDEIVGVDNGTDEFEGGTMGTNFCISNYFCGNYIHITV